MTTVDPTPSVQDFTAPLNGALIELQTGEIAWAATTLSKRAALLAEFAASVENEAETWVRTAAEIKGLDASSPLVGEEWLSGPYPLLTSIRTLRQTILAIARAASPIEHTRLGAAPGGRVIVPVLPDTAHEKVPFHGFRADVWMKPGVTMPDAARNAGLVSCPRPRRAASVWCSAPATFRSRRSTCSTNSSRTTASSFSS